MLVKGLVVTALVASTPIAIVATQDPRPASAPATPTVPVRGDAGALRRLEDLQQQAVQKLAATQRELDAARTELARTRQQLDGALDALDKTYEPQRDRNCSPSRGRALMSHYQFLRDQGHPQRAAGTLTKVVDQVGEDQNQRNSVAWNLMTDKDTAGKFDDVALAIAQRMEQTGAEAHHHLDTIALAHFLSGKVDRAIELQQKAITNGGNGDDYRRRLRTYEAARDAIAKHQPAPVPSMPTLVAEDGGD
jgi:tetratricopeptide (TPR) repeat protein